jgi:hypothetical protein
MHDLFLGTIKLLSTIVRCFYLGPGATPARFFIYKLKGSMILWSKPDYMINTRGLSYPPKNTVTGLDILTLLKYSDKLSTVFYHTPFIAIFE